MLDTKRLRRLAAPLWAVLACATGAANAASIGCGPSQVTTVATGASGDVVVALEGGNVHAICNLMGQGGFTTSAEPCKATYAALLAAKMAGQRVALYYNDLPSCGSITSWYRATTFYYVAVE